MPGRPKEKLAGTRDKSFRLDATLVGEVEARTSNFTRAVEEGLRLWLAREKRRESKAVIPRLPEIP